MSSIRFEHVSKQYPGAMRPVVDDCSFEVANGSFVVLLGPSGCGKTTLLKMINRLIATTSGTIIIDDVPHTEIDATALRRRIGYVIQQVGLFPHMTVARNVAVVPQLLRWERSRIDARVSELLALVDLPPTEYRDRYPAQLSGGQQQRVGLARALAADPQIILMDEPFGAIDAITRTTLQDELLRLHRKLHKTIVFVTHDVEEALRLADKILIMQQGRVVQYDTPLAVLTRPATPFVRSLVGGDDLLRQLSLLRVNQAMVALPPQYQANGAPTIAVNADLRVALGLLLQTGAPELTVVDEAGPIGLLAFDQIRASTLDEAAP